MSFLRRIRFWDGLAAGAAGGAVFGVLFVALLTLHPFVTPGLDPYSEGQTNLHDVLDFFRSLVFFSMFGAFLGAILGGPVTLLLGNLIERRHSKLEMQRWFPFPLILVFAGLAGAVTAFVTGSVIVSPSIVYSLLAQVGISGAAAGVIAASVFMRASKFIAHPWSIYFQYTSASLAVSKGANQ